MAGRFGCSTVNDAMAAEEVVPGFRRRSCGQFVPPMLHERRQNAAVPCQCRSSATPAVLPTAATSSSTGCTVTYLATACGTLPTPAAAATAGHRPSASLPMSRVQCERSLEGQCLPTQGPGPPSGHDSFRLLVSTLSTRRPAQICPDQVSYIAYRLLFLSKFVH
jgi:hypothetical protein